MAFTATKREWSELCTFLQLLGKGKVAAGNVEGKTSSELPIAYVQREEHNGTRRYYVEGEEVHIVGEGIDHRIPREDCSVVADLILNAIKTSSDEVESPEGVEEFLDALDIYDLEAQTEDRTDLYIAFYSNEMRPMGFRVYSRLGAMTPLLDGGRSANFKFEQIGVRFPSPTVNKVNALETDDTVLDRMLMIERLGGDLKFNDATDKIFRSNLHMIDLHFPRMMGEMVRIMFYEGTTRMNELLQKIKEKNPLKIKDKLITKHGYYDYKIREFLLAIAAGMRPAKIFNGRESAVEGILLMNADGSVLCYSKLDRQTFADFLVQNTRLEKSDLQKDHYGCLEKENGLYYFKLNLKVSLLKR